MRYVIETCKKTWIMLAEHIPAGESTFSGVDGLLDGGVIAPLSALHHGVVRGPAQIRI